MASNTQDPLGVVAERARLDVQITTLTAAISAWSGDSNGLNDMRLKNSEASFRVNSLTTATTNHLTNMAGTAFNQFGLEIVST